jgi:Glycosyl transferase family 2
VTHQPLVSILICCYNYERFVRESIESALAQAWPRTEVVVVDDGSTDNTWSVIESFGQRIKAIRQPNGGQGAAYNTCFANSRGDWVIFLDCDDLLDEDCLVRCLDRVRDDVNKVAFSLRVVDDQGSQTGSKIPYTMHEGDVRATLRRFGHYGGPPGSGNLYRRSSIERFFPLDERFWKIGADTVPYVVSAAFGQVAALHEPAGSYRIHSKANIELGLFGNVLGSLVETLMRDDRWRVAAMALVAQTLEHDASVPLLPTPTQIRMRVISWRIARAEHPYPGDSSASLARLAWRSVGAWPGFGLVERLVLTTWAIAIIAIPRSLIPGLVRLNASNSAKMRMRRLVSKLNLRRRSPAP